MRVSCNRHGQLGPSSLTTRDGGRKAVQEVRDLEFGRDLWQVSRTKSARDQLELGTQGHPAGKEPAVGQKKDAVGGKPPKTRPKVILPHEPDHALLRRRDPQGAANERRLARIRFAP